MRSRNAKRTKRRCDSPFCAILRVGCAILASKILYRSTTAITKIAKGETTLFKSWERDSEPGPEMSIQQKREKDKEKVISNRTRELCFLYSKPEVFAIPESRSRKPERPQPEMTNKNAKSTRIKSSPPTPERVSDFYTRNMGPEKKHSRK